MPRLTELVLDRPTVKVTCRRGHPMAADPANVYVTPAGLVKCVTCQRLSDHRHLDLVRLERQQLAAVTPPAIPKTTVEVTTGSIDDSLYLTTAPHRGHRADVVPLATWGWMLRLCGIPYSRGVIWAATHTDAYVIFSLPNGGNILGRERRYHATLRVEYTLWR
jgi:hypothetical protein